MKYFSLIAILCIIVTSACIEDGFSSSPADQPTFSVDTLRMGEAFTAQGTPTQRFTVYNRHDKAISISTIAMRESESDMFRLNVDGISGRTFSNVEIRPNDSIFVYIEATLPENGVDAPVDYRRHIDFSTNGVTSSVVVEITGQDAVRLDNLTVDANRTFTANKPYIIYGQLRVSPGVEVNVEPGTRFRFHDKAEMIVEGTLRAVGTPDAPIEMLGDRDGFVAAQIPYELMSGQWGGVYFAPTSCNNVISHASIRNSSYGIVLDSITDGTALTMTNSQVRNTTDRVVTAYHSNTRMVGCELTEASNGPLLLIGGKHEINHCTIANYYLFTALGAPSIEFVHLNADSDDGSGLPYMEADFTNSIIYGNGTLLSHGDLAGTNVFFRNCLIGVAGTDDDNFIATLWDADPLFHTVRVEYLFDYHVKPDSPAIGASDPALDRFGFTADRFGVAAASPADLGALTFTPPAE